jgi:hypothetical protein
MIASLKATALITVLFTALMAVVILAAPSYADSDDNAGAIQSRAALSAN